MTIVGGYRISSATSGQTAGVLMDVGVMPLSGQFQRGVPGGLIVLMYKYHPASGRWIPYI